MNRLIAAALRYVIFSVGRLLSNHIEHKSVPHSTSVAGCKADIWRIAKATRLIQFRHKRLDRHPTRRAIELRLRATAGGSMKRALGKTVVGSILTTAAIRYRDEPAIYCSSTDRRFSFGAVDDRVNRLAQALGAWLAKPFGAAMRLG